MPFSENLRKIDSYLEKIRALNDDVGRKGTIDRLQADLVREYLRDLYELYADLGKADAAPAPAPEPEPVAADPPVIPAETGSDATEEPPVPETVEPPAEPVEPAGEMKHAVNEPDNGSDAHVKPEPPEAAADGPISLLEKFQKESGRPGKELNRKQVAGSGLKKLIPLNEKIMMTREFFDNNVSAYETVLAELDTMQSRKEVLDYMQKRVWTDDLVENQRELIDRFISLIDLKFAGEE